jgi:hypothetical protein
LGGHNLSPDNRISMNCQSISFKFMASWGEMCPVGE